MQLAEPKSYLEPPGRATPGTAENWKESIPSVTGRACCSEPDEHVQAGEPFPDGNPRVFDMPTAHIHTLTPMLHLCIRGDHFLLLLSTSLFGAYKYNPCESQPPRL